MNFIHITPEAYNGGPLAKLRDGDIIRLCAARGDIVVLLDAAEWKAREFAPMNPQEPGTGRELFAFMRIGADEAEKGGSAMLAAAGL